MRANLTVRRRHWGIVSSETAMRLADRLAAVLVTLALGASVSALASPWTPRSDALPPGLLAGLSMDAKAGDVDGDGDADLVVAMEWAPLQVLLNDGNARFHADPTRVPQTTHDHEEAALADLDGDDDLDLAIVSEDDRAAELWLNDGRGRFTIAAFDAASAAVGNGIIAVDVDSDGDRDLVTANADGDRLLRNDGRAGFTHDRDALPPVDGISQDVIAGDVDGDGDADLVFGKENGARLLLNDGNGRFALAPVAQWPALADETRKVGLGDVDADGDLDVYLANTRFSRPQADAQDRLLLNDGRGRFSDVTATQLPTDTQNGFHGDLHDLDGDGDLDLLSADVVFGAPQPSPVRALLNDGTGRFAAAPASLWPTTIRGPLFDSVMLDVDGDGRAELFLAMRAAPDVLLAR
jgi:hypothetical protein